MNKNFLDYNLDLLTPNDVLFGFIIITLSLSIYIYTNRNININNTNIGIDLAEQTELHPRLNQIEELIQGIQNNYADHGMQTNIQFLRNYIGRDYLESINQGINLNELEINNRITELINSENLEFIEFIHQWQIDAQESLNFLLNNPNPDHLIDFNHFEYLDPFGIFNNLDYLLNILNNLSYLFNNFN